MLRVKPDECLRSLEILDYIDAIIQRNLKSFLKKNFRDFAKRDFA